MFRIQAIAAVMVGTMVTQAQAERDRGEAPRTRIRKGGVTVPIDLSRVHPSVKVRINGRGPFVLTLDTGAGTTVLNEDLAKELGLRALDETRIGDPSNPQAIAATVTRLDRVSLGGAEFEGVDAVWWTREPIHGGADAPRGVLGYPLFARCLLTLDYAKNCIRIEDGALPAPDGRDILPLLEGEGGIAAIEIDLAGKSARAHIDSGAMSSLAVNDSMKTKLPLAEPPTVIGRGRTANSEFELTAAPLDGEVRIGRHAIKNPRLSFNPVVPHANIGSGLLPRFVVTFDQAHGRVRFIANPESPDAVAEAAAPVRTVRRGPGGKPRLGVALSIHSAASQPMISDVVAGSPAEKAGLRKGDLILEINDEPVKLPIDEQLQSALAGDSLTFVVERKGRRETIRVALGA